MLPKTKGLQDIGRITAMRRAFQEPLTHHEFIKNVMFSSTRQIKNIYVQGIFLNLYYILSSTYNETNPVHHT